MDKTLQMIVVAALIMLVAVVVLFLVSGNSGGFGDIVGNKTGSATCTTLKTQYANACNCNAETGSPETGKAKSFRSEADSKNCGWVKPTYRCTNVCS